MITTLSVVDKRAPNPYTLGINPYTCVLSLGGRAFVRFSAQLCGWDVFSFNNHRRLAFVSAFGPERSQEYCVIIMPAYLEKYRPYVDAFDISEDQKAELIHSLWMMAEAFADHAFGIEPTQRVLDIKALENCEAGPEGVDS